MAKKTQPKDLWKKSRLGAEEFDQLAQKNLLIKAAYALMQCVGSGGDVKGTANRNCCLHLRGSACAVGGGGIQHEVAARREPNQNDRLTSASKQCVDHVDDVAVHPGMIEGAAERFGSAAIAHVIADYVHAGFP